MIRAGIAASLLLTFVSSASADIPRPNRPAVRDVCKAGRNAVSCSKAGRGYVGVAIRSCTDRNLYGIITGPGANDAPVEKARFRVRKMLPPRGMMGAPVTYKGTGFALKVNHTTAPRPDGTRVGKLDARKGRLAWNTAVNCR